MAMNKKRILDEINVVDESKRRVYALPYTDHPTPVTAKSNFFEAFNRIFLQIYERAATTKHYVSSPGSVIDSGGTVMTTGAGEGFIHTLSKTSIPIITPGMDLIVGGEHYMISRVEGIDADSATIVTHKKADFAAATTCTVETPEYFGSGNAYTIIGFDITPYYAGNRACTQSDGSLPTRQAGFLTNYGNSWTRKLRITMLEDSDDINFGATSDVTKTDYIVNYLGGCIIARGNKSANSFAFDIDGHSVPLSSLPTVDSTTNTNKDTYNIVGVKTPVQEIVSVESEDKSGEFTFFNSSAQYFAQMITEDYDSGWGIAYDTIFDSINDVWQCFMGEDWDKVVDPESGETTNEVKTTDKPFGFAIMGCFERPVDTDGNEIVNTKDLLWYGVIGFSAKMSNSMNPIEEEGKNVKIGFECEQNLILKAKYNLYVS